MILIGLGANLASRFGPPSATLAAAKRALVERGVVILQSSRVWLTAPVPFDPDQDWFHNAVIDVETDLSPQDLLTLLLELEENFGRVRSVKNAPRLLDLDIIAYNDDVIEQGDTLLVPHPKMQERLFVLKPLSDISKNWTHPVSGQSVEEMVRLLADDNQQAKPLEEGSHD